MQQYVNVEVRDQTAVKAFNLNDKGGVTGVKGALEGSGLMAKECVERRLPREVSNGRIRGRRSDCH